MVTTTETLDISAYSEEIVTQAVANSAFISVTPGKPIKVGQTTGVFSTNRFSPQWVAEGATKPTGGSVSKIEVKVEKMAFIYVTTEEADLALPAVSQAIVSDAPSFFAQTFDRTVAGLETAPSALFHTLAGATSAVVTDYASLLGAMGAVGATGNSPTGIVMSEGLYWSLLGITGEDGHPILNPETGTILGLKVTRFASPEKVGFVGDFRRAFHGVTLDPIVRVATAGTVTDFEGISHNLTQDNKTAYIVEGFYAFGVVDEDAFIKLTVAGS